MAHDGAMRSLCKVEEQVFNTFGFKYIGINSIAQYMVDRIYGF